MARTIDLSVDLVRSAQLSSGPLRTLAGATLTVLEQRYKQFLALVQAHPERVLAPTGDIDEMWHLHMMHPRAYVNDCLAMFGDIVDHDPEFGNPDADPATLAALDAHFAATAALWEQVYGEPYMLAQLDARADAAEAAPALGATYCVKSAAGSSAGQPVLLGSTYCVKSAAARAAGVSMGATYCVRSAPGAAPAVALGATYCVRSAPLTGALPVALGQTYCVKSAAPAGA